MTRPRVPDDKRQRTANACDSCKRRKQKCDGERPCGTCGKRDLACVYSTAQPVDRGLSDSEESPKKKRPAELSPPPSGAAATDPGFTAVGEASAMPAELPSPDTVAKRRRVQKPVAEKSKPRQTIAKKPKAPIKPPPGDLGRPDVETSSLSKDSSTSGRGEDDAVFHTDPRMLQDTRGRLLYIGDAATLSYVQLMRMVVETVSGPSNFTTDPNRHRIVENTITLPPQISPVNTMLPDRATAEVLVDSYFTNTSGIIEVLDRRVFQAQLDACYSDPLAVDPMFPCLLYNTFAIGLVLANPVPGSNEDAVVQRLRSVSYDYAELFYQTARTKGDPCYPLEDAGFWSVQALLLMTVYSLAVVKRNNAYNLLGMATRSAYALGLHRQEDNIMQLFTKEERALRRLVWKSLFVLDRFVSSSLGRPLGIYDGDCSPEALRIDKEPQDPSGRLAALDAYSPALDASFRSSQTIGQTLRALYLKRKMVSGTAREIALHHDEWAKTLHPDLHWRRTLEPHVSAAKVITIVHVNLLECHSAILLTRPLFLCHLFNVLDKQLGRPPRAQRLSPKMFNFSETCVAAAYHSVYLVQIAYEAKALSSHDPFAIYCLFLSTFVVLSNEFVALYLNDAYESTVQTGISIMRHFAEDSDIQAQRLVYILESYAEAVALRRQKDRPHYPHNLPQILAPSHPDYNPLGRLVGPRDVPDAAPRAAPPAPASTSESRPRSEGTSRAAFFPPSQVRSPAAARRASLQSPTVMTPHPGGISASGSLNGASPSRPGPMGLSPVIHFHGSAPPVELSGSRGPDSVGTDAEFHFDTLWKWPFQQATGPAHASLAPAAIEPPAAAAAAATSALPGAAPVPGQPAVPGSAPPFATPSHHASAPDLTLAPYRAPAPVMPGAQSTEPPYQHDGPLPSPGHVGPLHAHPFYTPDQYH